MPLLRYDSRATSSAKTHVISGMHDVGGDAVRSKASDVHLPMVPVMVNGKLMVNALLDSGSMNIYIRIPS